MRGQDDKGASLCVFEGPGAVEPYRVKDKWATDRFDFTALAADKKISLHGAIVRKSAVCPPDRKPTRTTHGGEARHRVEIPRL